MASSLFKQNQTSTNTRRNNGLGQLMQLANEIKQKGPEAIFNQMYQSNPEFKQFVDNNQGKSMEQIARENNILFLADGKYRKIENPKKKKEKHVQQIYRFPDPIRVLIEGIAELKDSDIKKIIKSYEQLTNKEN